MARYTRSSQGVEMTLLGCVNIPGEILVEKDEGSGLKQHMFMEGMEQCI